MAASASAAAVASASGFEAAAASAGEDGAAAISAEAAAFSGVALRSKFMGMGEPRSAAVTRLCELALTAEMVVGTAAAAAVVAAPAAALGAVAESTVGKAPLHSGEATGQMLGNDSGKDVRTVVASA